MTVATNLSVSITSPRIPRKPDASEIIETLRLFSTADDQVFELRAKCKSPGYAKGFTRIGYYDDAEAMARDACAINDHEAVYFIANPIDPRLIARSNNRIDRTDKAVGDLDVLSRHWLLLDCDPVRPSGVASSDDEHEAAIDRARAVRQWLESRDVPIALLADSGNGAHLLIRIDLPTKDDELCQRFIEGVSALFSDDAVKVDEGTYKPSQPIRLYGTQNRKGDASTDFPHRFSSIIEAAEHIQIVPRIALEQLAVPKEHRQAANSFQGQSAFDLEDFIASNFPDAGEPQSWSGGHRWRLKTCPFNETHTNSAIIAKKANGAIIFSCLKESCRGHKWQDVRRKLDPDYDPNAFGVRHAIPRALTRPNSYSPTAMQTEGSTRERKRETIGPVPLAASYLLDKCRVRAEAHDYAALRHYSGDFYRFGGACYERLHPEALRSAVYTFIESSGLVGVDSINTTLVNNVVDALRSKCFTDVRRMPSWVEDSADRPEPENVIAFKNGLLDMGEYLETGEMRLTPPTPAWFSTIALPYKFEREAACPEWQKRISGYVDGDVERMNAVQEFFGLCLTPNMKFHKGLMLIGPPRSGKGTTLRTLMELIGQDNCSSPNLSDLGTQFGLHDLLGKRCAIVADAHLRASDQNMSTILDTLTKIIGGDAMTINRKYKEPVPNAFLETRFAMAANSLPKIKDSSKAVVSRFIIVRMPNSFQGKQSATAEDSIRREKPGIILWAMAGLKRLLERGHFVQPKVDEEAIEQFNREMSPVHGFVEDCCELDPRAKETKEDLRRAWKRWAEENGNEPGNAETFGSHLMAAFSTVKGKRAGTPNAETGKREYEYHGIRLRHHDHVM